MCFKIFLSFLHFLYFLWISNYTIHRLRSTHGWGDFITRYFSASFLQVVFFYSLLVCVYIFLKNKKRVSSFIFSLMIILFISFFLCMLLPWSLFILSLYRQPYALIIDKNFIHIFSRIKNKSLILLKEDIKNVIRIYNVKKGHSSAHVVIVPKDPTQAHVYIDISQQSSIVKAKELFIKETLLIKLVVFHLYKNILML